MSVKNKLSERFILYANQYNSSKFEHDELLNKYNISNAKMVTIEKEFIVMEKEINYLLEAVNHYYQSCYYAYQTYENEYNKAVKLGSIKQAFQISRLHSLHDNFTKKNEHSRKLWNDYESKLSVFESIKKKVNEAKRCTSILYEKYKLSEEYVKLNELVIEKLVQEINKIKLDT